MPRPSRYRSTVSVALVAVASLVRLVAAHGDHAEVEQNPDATYSELHMAQEHHMDSFDIQAFFHLHDLNRDGILDRNEIESIYGVHHEKKRKGAKNLEVHTQQANEIVDAVLSRLDQNGDGLLTMREFVDGGVGGLPNFKGVEHLGHHYDAEGEYFLHHEEQFHNTPETQTEDSYIHPEDIEHFMSHEAIEHEEEAREREFTGQDPDIAPSDLSSVTPEQLQQHIFNELNGIPDEAETRAEKEFVHDAVKDEDAHNPHAEMVKPVPVKEMPAAVYNPQGGDAAAARGESQSSQQTRLQRQTGPDDGSPERAPSPQERIRRERAQFARQQAAKFSQDAREARKRGEWGTGNADFGRPKDAADRLRRNIPYKYKVRTSWFGA